MQFPGSFLDEVVAQTDILEFVGEYVTLKKSGREYKGLCPFHGEKTPSFSVSQEKGLFHCFGCGIGGSVINFAMEAEGLERGEAVEFLARRAGMAIPAYSQKDNSQERALQEKIFNINKQAALFYYHSLQTPQGKDALAYLTERGLTPKTITHFALGYAPNSWNALSQHMEPLGYTVADLAQAGLMQQSKNNGQMYEIFRNRVIFPIVNLKKEVVGFGGRIMEDRQPKYLNSPDSPVFNKSKNLFALNLAKKCKSGTGILTEGYMDAIALHQAGFDGAVASLGTAFTSQQAQLMRRYFKKTVLCYDSDKAGQSATQRAIPLLDQAGVEVRILQMTGAKDPDELIKNHGADSFAHLLNQSIHHIDYRFQLMRQQYNLEDNAARVHFLEEASAYLATMESHIQREIYATKVGEWIGVSKEGIMLEVGKELEKQKWRAKRKIEKNAINPTVAYSGQKKSLYQPTRASRGEEGLVRVCFLDPQLLAELCDFTAEVFSVPFLGRVFELMKLRQQQCLPLELHFLTEFITQEEMSQLVEILRQPQDKENLRQGMVDYLAVMEEEYDKRFLVGDERLIALQKQMTEEKEN